MGAAGPVAPLCQCPLVAVGGAWQGGRGPGCAGSITAGCRALDGGPEMNILSPPGGLCRPVELGLGGVSCFYSGLG